MEFYRFVESGKSFVDYGMGNDWEGIVCPLNEGHQRAGPRITPLRLKVTSRKVVDFSWTFFSDIVITDHAYQILQSEGLTGFEVRPTEVVSVPKSFDVANLPKLWELRVTGWGGMARPESGIKKIRDCPACGHLVYSGCINREQLIDASQYDKSDFFFVWPLPKFVFVTERVIKVIHEKKLTGTKLVSLKDLNLLSDDTYSPGRLHYDLPEDRAHALGDPLGIY